MCSSLCIVKLWLLAIFMSNTLMLALKAFAIPNFGAEWDQVVRFALRPFYSLGENTR
jgi:hypothetical protein